MRRRMSSRECMLLIYGWWLVVAGEWPESPCKAWRLRQILPRNVRPAESRRCRVNVTGRGWSDRRLASTRRRPDQHNLQVTDVGVGRPGPDQISEPFEELVRVVVVQIY